MSKKYGLSEGWKACLKEHPVKASGFYQLSNKGIFFFFRLIQAKALGKKCVYSEFKAYWISFLRFGPYYIEPVIAGLDPKTFEPFICSLDLIGCPMVTEDFVVSGTCAEQMYGMCESLWEPDMVSGTQGGYSAHFSELASNKRTASPG